MVKQAITEYSAILTTAPNSDQAKRIIDALLSEKLAACIQTIPIESHYVWEGEVCNDNEILLVIKTTNALFREVEQSICEQHEYDIPQIVQLPITDGFNPYLSWISQVTR